MGIEDRHEFRVVIRHANSGPDDARLIPASVFRKFFNAFFDAAKAARSDIIVPKGQGIMQIADLKMGSNEFAICEKGIPQEISPICLLNRCTTAVYRSDFDVAVAHPALARKIVKIGKAYNKAFSAHVQFDQTNKVPVDEVFCRRVTSLHRMLEPSFSETPHFAGKAIDNFVGTLSELNSHNDTWTAWLKLHGDKKIECVLDKSKGEEAYRSYWNKRVSITGRSTYTGLGLLPDSFEVMKIEEIKRPEKYVDIRGSRMTYENPDWDFNFADIQ